MRESKFRRMMAQKTEGHDSVWAYKTDLDSMFWRSGNGVYYQDFKPNTICMYTGRKDKAGKEMYGGDIIKDHEGAIKRIEYIDDYMTFCPFTGIEWDLYNEGSNHFKYCYDVRDDGSRPLKFLCWYESYELEVIGNIHENPDLLENDEEAV